MDYAVIWCDSPRGLISFEEEPNTNLPRRHDRVPYSATPVGSSDELFGILIQRDGTKVCFRYDKIPTYLGWTI